MEEALKRYFKHFGENYPLMIVGTMTDEEIVARIDRCIEINQAEAEPEYTDDADY